MQNLDDILSRIREDFPILQTIVHGQGLVYFDNGATTQKPVQVLKALEQYYSEVNSNIHRGIHFLSKLATEHHEQHREHVRSFINAQHKYEIIFTRGTTDSINLVAYSFGKAFFKPGDEVLITTMEHHSNIVPWQLACEERGAVLKVVPINDDGTLQMDAFDALITERTRIVALTHVSNTLGTINPVKEVIALAHAKGVPVLVDGAQAVAHMKVDVRDLDCDFYCFSGHKMYGPMGIGVLYGKEKWLEKMPPYQGGGEMIDKVTFEKSTWNELPFKFEAGTPNVADVAGLDAAISYIEGLGFELIHEIEKSLMDHALRKLGRFEGMRFIGQAKDRAGVISFLPFNIHPYDAGIILDRYGIAVRTGHHCTQPLMDRFGIPGTIRVSFGLYNTREEIDRLIQALVGVYNMFG
jgi:cysteine desulfurase / selenocysteine lyase